MKHVKTRGYRKGQWTKCRQGAFSCDKDTLHMPDKMFDYATEYYSDLNQLEQELPTPQQMRQFKKQFKDHELGYLAHRLEKVSDDEWHTRTIQFVKPANLTKLKYEPAAKGFIKACLKAEQEDVLIQIFFQDNEYAIVTPSLVEAFKENFLINRKVARLTFIGARSNVKTVVNFFNKTSTDEGY